MNRYKLLRYCLILGFLLLSSAPAKAFSAELKVEAYTDRSTISVGEPLVLTIKVSGEGKLPAPPDPSHEGFDIIRKSSTSSYTWINGKATSYVMYQYRMIPQSEGRYSIGETSVSLGGVTYSSSPVEITVEQVKQPAPGEEEELSSSVSADPSGRVIVSASLDKDEIYVGEGVVYTFSFFRKVRLWETPQYHPPEFTDFWVEELPRESSPREVIIRGERYLREDIKKILFPTSSGSVDIKGTAISVQLDPFSNAVTLITDPIELYVKSLPMEPQGFSGAVGNFAITADLERKKVKEGEPLTVRVSLAGVGNIKALRPPLYEESEFFRGYEPKDSMDISTLNNLISGTKSFEYLFIPLRSGEVKLPPFSLTYFDPADEEYKTVSTREIPVTILPAEGGVTISKGSSDALGEEIFSQKMKLMPLRMKSDLSNWNPRGYAKGPHLLLIVLPPLIFLVLWLFRALSRRKEKRMKTLMGVRLSLERAEGLLKAGEHKEFYAEAVSGLAGYILDRTGLPRSAKSNREMLEILTDRSYPEEVVEMVEKIFERGDRGRFSPAAEGALEMDAFLADVRSIVQKLETVLLESGGKG